MNQIRLKYQQDTGIQIDKHIPGYPAELHDYIEWLEEQNEKLFNSAQMWDSLQEAVKCMKSI